MRNRSIKKQVWINRDELYILKKKAEKIGITDSELIRNLIVGYEPKEKPDQRFYDVIKQITAIGRTLNQILLHAHKFDSINVLLYKKEVEKLNQFMLEIKRTYLLPKVENKEE